MPSSSELTHTKPLHLLLGAASVVIVLFGVKAAASVLTPLLLALLLALACQPILNTMAKFRIPRALGAVLLLSVIVLLGFLLSKVVTSTTMQIMSKLPFYEQQFNALLIEVLSHLAAWDIVVEPKVLLGQIGASNAISVGVVALSGLGTALSSTFLLLLIVSFMLLEAKSLPAKLTYIAKGAMLNTSPIVVFVKSVERYLLIKTATSALTGICITLLLLLLGVDYAVLWGVLAFLLNFIPTIGSVIAAVPAIVVTLIDAGLSSSLYVAGVFTVVNVLVGNVAEPKIMGKQLGLSAFVVLLSLLFWGGLLGPVGMLMSIPLTMIIKLALASTPALERWSVLLADEVPTQPVVNTPAVSKKKPPTVRS